MIAALFVQDGGAYFGLDGVDPWDESRDARGYAGPWPVVAHPPCARWCALAKLVESQGGKRAGDDDGCFEAALRAVMTYGGVLEHPAWSWAFKRFGLGVPQRGGWQRLVSGAWTTAVNQAAYGHLTTKETWLVAAKVQPPSMDWRDIKGSHTFSAGRRRGNGSWWEPKKPSIKRMSSSATPPAFRDLLLSIARSAVPRE